MIQREDLEWEGKGAEQAEQVSPRKPQALLHAEKIHADEGDAGRCRHRRLRPFPQKHAVDGDEDDVERRQEPRLAGGGVLDPDLLQA